MKPVFRYLFLTLLLVLFAGSCKKSSVTPPPPPPPKPGTAYFMVSELSANPPHGDSYILKLTDADNIAKARDIVNGNSRAQIVSARIVRGSGDGTYLNKNLLGGRVWSWYVAEFFSFADVTAEIYDSWPTFIEENLDFWMQTNQGIIGFWSYTVTREVPLSELQ